MFFILNFTILTLPYMIREIIKTAKRLVAHLQNKM